MTAAHLLGLDIAPKGGLRGRVLSEALMGGEVPAITRAEQRARPGRKGFAPILRTQSAGGETYFDVAGVMGRTVGLTAD